MAYQDEYGNWIEENDQTEALTAAFFEAGRQAALGAINEEVGPMLQQAYLNGRAETDGMRQALADQAYLEADRALAANYGDEWVESRDAVVQFLNDNADLLPAEQRMNPQAVADRLDLIFKSTREDRRQARDAEAFDKIKRAEYRTYSDLMRGRREES